MENTNFGKCCICESENTTVRNAITLDKKIPDTETNGGWGCFQCGKDPRGAVAVLCDDCLDDWMNRKTELKFACLGYPPENRRIEVEKLTEVWEHDLSKHPEVAEQMNFIETKVADLDWKTALQHFRAVCAVYQELAGTPGVNTTLALEQVFRPLSERYHRGERSAELHAEMMAVE